ncbi:hypothetical protein M406DRAFT_71508, partial [Cryphonectria parasitica EP155]
MGMDNSKVDYSKKRQLKIISVSTTALLLARERLQFEGLVHEMRSTFVLELDTTVTSTKGLVYLEAVINETLRINHHNPSSTPRSVPGGLDVAGNLIPKITSWTEL